MTFSIAVGRSSIINSILDDVKEFRQYCNYTDRRTSTPHQVAILTIVGGAVAAKSIVYG